MYIIIVSFMQGIYTYIPETNCVPREYSVAAILLLLFMVLISLVSVLNLLYFYISTYRSVCVCVCAVPNMAVFCSSLTSENSHIGPSTHTSESTDVKVLLLLSSSSSSLSSPLCRVFILTFLRQTVSLGNTVLQPFCCYYSRCLYR